MADLGHVNGSDPVGFGRCVIGACTWQGPVELKSVADNRSTWHVYLEHPDHWRIHMGDRHPGLPHPEGPSR